MVQAIDLVTEIKIHANMFKRKLRVKTEASSFIPGFAIRAVRFSLVLRTYFFLLKSNLTFYV